MKSLLIQLLVLPRGLIFLGIFCSTSLVLLTAPVETLADGGDEFPGQRRGGGTHVTMQTTDFQ